MAAFCTRCGAALAPGTQFCTSCGAPASSAAAPAQPHVSQPPIYGQPVYGQPVVTPVPPPPSANSALKIVLIVVAVLVGLGLLSSMAFFFGMWRLSHAVRVGRGGDVVLSTPTGTISTGSAASVTEADLGVPFYPGATRREGGMQVRSVNGSMMTVVFSTTDPVSKVVDFYRNKLGDNASVIQAGNGAVISSGQQNKEGVVITVSSDTSDSTTKITIMRSKTK